MTIIFTLMGGLSPARAQDDTTILRQIDVFVAESPDTTTSTIYFLDALSGLNTVINVENGELFTLVGDYVLYAKTHTGAIMSANRDGILSPHPFIRPEVDTEAIWWVTSPNHAAIAWVRVNTAGQSEAYVAWADGRDLRQLPISSPEAPLMLFPVALNTSRTLFFYDAAHSTTITPYPAFAHIITYDIANEMFSTPPSEPNCLCGAAVSPDGRIFARLESTQIAAEQEANGPFALRVWDLPTNASFFIPAPDLDYGFAGDLLLNTFGTFAVYSVATGVGIEADSVQTEYALVLVDVVAQQQRLLVDAGPVRYCPVTFLDDNNALMLTDGTSTYKLDLASGDLTRVSDLRYLGTITLTG
ncbi:MAG: hypothetical protein JXA10_04880 [Anaerolineae bacterium]|nr:hypothetical protein [Anaerolineae bacterium]